MSNDEALSRKEIFLEKKSDFEERLSRRAQSCTHVGIIRQTNNITPNATAGIHGRQSKQDACRISNETAGYANITFPTWMASLPKGT